MKTSTGLQWQLIQPWPASTDDELHTCQGMIICCISIQGNHHAISYFSDLALFMFFCSGICSTANRAYSHSRGEGSGKVGGLNIFTSNCNIVILVLYTYVLYCCVILPHDPDIVTHCVCNWIWLQLMIQCDRATKSIYKTFNLNTSMSGASACWWHPTAHCSWGIWIYYSCLWCCFLLHWFEQRFELQIKYSKYTCVFF